MSITVQSGATSSQTGGTAQTFTLDNQGANGSSLYVCETDSQESLRKTLSLSSSSPVLPTAEAPNGSYGKRRAVLTIPVMGVDGVKRSRRAVVELTFLPTDTVTEVMDLIQYAQSILIDADLAKFREKGFTNVG